MGEDKHRRVLTLSIWAMFESSLGSADMRVITGMRLKEMQYKKLFTVTDSHSQPRFYRSCVKQSIREQLR